MLKAKILLGHKLPKFGNSDTECEDAFSCKSKRRFLKIALADGATESSFAKEWANILVENLDFSKTQFIRRLSSLRSQWLLGVDTTNLPWYAEAKLEKGAFSTLLVLSVDFKTETYKAFAIGDCCLYHVREDSVVLSFPIQTSNDFSNSPFLVSTRKDYDDELKIQLKETGSRNIQSGDFLLLMSDALAHWFAIEAEKNERPWKILLGFSEDSSGSAFEGWLNDRRRLKEIKNDDTTLIVIEII
jgi:hypothetical protein